MKKILIFLVAGLLANPSRCLSQVQANDGNTTVYYPLIGNNETKIFDWVINRVQRDVKGNTYSFYKLYLNSLNCRYSLFVPTDKSFGTYIDPVAFGQEVPQAGMQFKFDPLTSAVYAVVRTFNKDVEPFTFSDSIGIIKDQAFLQDRLCKILDNHIVVGDVESGGNFFVTKGNDPIKVIGAGTEMTVSGGYEMSENTPSKVNVVHRQTNGNTYLIDKPIHPALKSVYKMLGEHPEFKNFFDLLVGVPDTCASKILSPQGIDKIITMFHTHRYTIYVPTNEAIQSAMEQDRIKSWATINAMPLGAQQATEINNLIRFLKYHFQDEAVFLGKNVDGIYQSSTIKNDLMPTHFKTGKNRFYKIGVNGNETSLTLTTETNQTARVVTNSGLYNLIAKDYLFSKVPSYYKNIDGSGPSTGSAFISSSIVTTSSAVIHQIDNVLNFQ